MCTSITDAFRATGDKGHLSSQVRDLLERELRICGCEAMGTADYLARVLGDGVLDGLHCGCVCTASTTGDWGRVASANDRDR